MENKTARLTILIDPIKKEAFEELCSQQDLKPSQVVRQLIREYLHTHGVDYATKLKSGVQNSSKK
ncbi:MAG: CopG family transcriptional regulator [Acinetobacter sp.]